MRSKAKLVVIFAFSARLPVIAVAAVRLYYLHQRFLDPSDLFEYVVATQWQMGYAIMSSTITGMGPFLRPFNNEYTTSYHKRSDYGHSSQVSHVPRSSRDADAIHQPQRSSWQSEGYLMQPIPSRRGSKNTLSDTNEPSVVSNRSISHMHSASSSSMPDIQQHSPSLQAPLMLVADANFRPIDNVSRNDTEIWGGDRTGSFGNEDAIRPRLRDDRGLVINKRTQVKVEIDRASRVI
jgi:hypothetical protein